MFITPSFKTSLIVEQIQGNYLNCKLNEKFHHQVPIIIHGVSVTAQKKKSNYSFSEVSAPAYERVFAYGNMYSTEICIIQSLTGR